MLKAITPKIEAKIDEVSNYKSNTNEVIDLGDDIKIPFCNIITYGEFKPNNIEDEEAIVNIVGIDNEEFRKNVPSTFNYFKSDDIVLIDGVVKYTDTCYIYDWFLYNHYLIGRPKLIAIFKAPLKMGKPISNKNGK